MIFIPRRKIVILLIFTFFLSLPAIFIHIHSKDVFSEKLTGTVIIDAGHGLPDGGAVGALGTVESSLNLSIAKGIQKNLEKKGYNVIMTREDENSLSDESGNISEKKKKDMRKRLEVINTTGADMFVSIHMNKFTDSRYKGAQVLYSGNFAESEKLAFLIQKRLHSLKENESQRSHMKAPAGLFLLKNAQIPAVLVECGFLSNYDEEKLLNTVKYRKALAKAITKGIEDYYKGEEENENICNR